MNKKILFSGLFPLYNYHHVAELNLMQEHLDAGDEVYYLACDASFLSCECNREHELAHCLRCVGMRQAGVSLLRGNVTPVPLHSSAELQKKVRKMQRRIRTLDDLKALRIGKFDLGMAVYSSLVDQSKSTLPDVLLWREKILALLTDALTAHETTLDFLRKSGVDLVYLFNGRYATARGILRACQEVGVDFYTHERKSDLNRIQLYKNTFPHDPRPYGGMVLEFWEANKGVPGVRESGVDFFEERPKRKLTGWYSMVGGQEKGKMPASWNPQRRNMAIFGSSEGEFVALQDLYEGSLFASQKEGYSALMTESLKLFPEVMYYLRLHPNSKNEQIRWWDEMKFPNLEIIEPESDVCSYTLMLSSEKVLGIGSSMCLESTYWEKPSLVFGLTFYAGINAVYECESVQEACELIGDKNLPPKPRENAVKFGAYMRGAGRSLPFSAPVNYYTLTFQGKVLEACYEVHEWLGECERRKPVSGWKKWLRGIQDRRKYQGILAAKNGFVGEPRVPE